MHAKLKLKRNERRKMIEGDNEAINFLNAYKNLFTPSEAVFK